ncbi:MAG: tetratricopeptide repeat protein [Lysobacterales bacterium]|nr:tetratricopeptide repeat protein [Xanthomonadales bacterium]MCP5474279.1 tetratricopeptide repeat protein [Rhodanobacteraceae bacterium]
MIYRFGVYRLDSERDTLADANGPVALRDHALRVLKLLLERAPEVVTKDQILAQVWGHDALSESAIPQVIKDIRQVLGDSAKSPELIVTRYGRGYQFVGYVEIEEDQAAAAVPVAVATRRRWLPGLIGLGVIAALTLVVLLWDRWNVTPGSEAQVQAAGPIFIRPIEPEAGESLSRPFAEYLSFVLGASGGSTSVTVADKDSPQRPGVQYLELSLAVSDNPDQRYALQFGSASRETEAQSQTRYFSKPEDLLGASLDQVVLSTGISPEFGAAAGITSPRAFATEILLRGMAAQFAGDIKRAIALFEACLAEDPNFDFARYELAVALRRNGDYQRAVAELNALQSHHRSDFWLNRIHNGKGIAFWRMGEYDEANASLRLAYQHATSPDTRAAAATNLALLLRDQGQLDAAETFAREAVSSADRVRHPRIAASALNTLASILMRSGRLRETLPPLDQARELFYAEGNRRELASVLSRTADVRSRLGQYQQAEQLLQVAIAIREQIGDELGVAASAFDLSRIARVQGDFRASRVHARRGLDLAASKSDFHLMSQGNLALAALALAEQRFPDATVYAAEAMRLASSRKQHRVVQAARIMQLRILVDSATDENQLRSAREQLRAQVGPDQTLLDQDRQGELHLLSGQLQRRLGDLHSAQNDFAAALDVAKAELINDLQLRSLLALAELHLGSNPDLSAEQLETASTLNPPAYPYLLLSAQAKWAQGKHREALVLAYQAKQQSGDWWRPADEAQLREMAGSKPSTAGEPH